MFRQIQHKRIYEDIVDNVIERVKSGELRVGDKLPSERLLAGEMGVSRNSLREALRYLESMGYISYGAGGRCYINEITPESLLPAFSLMLYQDRQFAIDVIGVRQQLEVHMTGMAAQNATQEQISRIYETIGAMRAEIEKGGVGIEGDNLFHLEIAKASGNKAMVAIAELCFELMSQSRRATLAIPGQPERALNDHMAIFEAIRGGDVRKAEEEMRAHLSKAHMNVSGIIEEEQNN